MGQGMVHLIRLHALQQQHTVEQIKVGLVIFNIFLFFIYFFLSSAPLQKECLLVELVFFSLKKYSPTGSVFLVLRQNVASHNVYVTKRNCY